MVLRPIYLDEIQKFVNKPLIKIITGIRRSGKSTILKLIEQRLREWGMGADQIILMNFESFAFMEYTTGKALYDFISQKAAKDKKTYLLLDEIQEVEGWEKAVNSFLTDFDCDIYITGSNSHLLSSELSTYLTGRYVEIPVFPLSFGEFVDFKKHHEPGFSPADVSFEQYLRAGGFPMIHTGAYDLETAYKIVRDIYSSVILRDTVQRHKIRDVELLERVVQFAFDNVGNTFSGKNVADYFKSQQRKTDVNTIYSYLHALEGSYVLHRVRRYDLRGREILKTQEKFYAGDVSLIYATMGIRDRQISGILENIVFLELKRRGYQVYVGKIDKKEIDFVAEKQSDKIYIQVAYKLDGEKTVEREFAPLLAVHDHYPKFVVSMDEFWKETIAGVRHMHIGQFLLSGSY